MSVFVLGQLPLSGLSDPLYIYLYFFPLFNKTLTWKLFGDQQQFCVCTIQCMVHRKGTIQCIVHRKEPKKKTWNVKIYPISKHWSVFGGPGNVCIAHMCKARSVKAPMQWKMFWWSRVVLWPATPLLANCRTTDQIKDNISQNVIRRRDVMMMISMMMVIILMTVMTMTMVMTKDCIVSQF